ncbi:MAG: hypothetical protein QE271_09780 [Bacteriovoracaceae bacterium]|nr:hypothetical protein [Bacteriovoracaceae bacterium]
MKQLFTQEELHDFNSSIIKLDFYLDMPSEQQKIDVIEKSARDAIVKLKELYQKCLLLN